MKAFLIGPLCRSELVRLGIKPGQLHPSFLLAPQSRAVSGITANSKRIKKGQEMNLLSLSLFPSHPPSFVQCQHFLFLKKLFPFKSGLKIAANFLQGNCSLKYITYHPPLHFCNASKALAVNM